VAQVVAEIDQHEGHRHGDPERRLERCEARDPEASERLRGRRDERGRRTITDVGSAAIALATLAGLVFVRRVPEPLWIVAAGLVGLALSRAGAS
jgi:hypothetical protein